MAMATMAFVSPHLMMYRLIFRRPTLPFFSLAYHSQANQSFTYLKATGPPFPSLASQANQYFPFLEATLFSNTYSFSLHSFSAPLSSFSQQLENDVVLLENVPTEPGREPGSSLSQQLENDVVLLENLQIEPEREPESADDVCASVGLKKLSPGPPSLPPPSLSVKEKKDLASYAHSLGKKLKSLQVGKSGVTDTVITALLETLEANELLKLKIHGTCPGELEDVVKHLEETTGSVAVGQIGRTVILYRPSRTKLKAEDNRKQAQRVYLKRQ